MRKGGSSRHLKTNKHRYIIANHNNDNEVITNIKTPIKLKIEDLTNVVVVDIQIGDVDVVEDMIQTEFL